MPQAYEWMSHGAFSGRKMLITGGASGIGAALVRLVFEHGGKVAILDRNRSVQPVDDAPPSTVREFQVDVGDEASVIEAVKDAADWLDGIDGVANVAGTLRDGTLSDSTVAEMYRPMAVNLFGPLYVCRAAFHWLKKADHPAVVNVSSLAGTYPYPGGGLYGPSKGALIALSHQLAFEWAPFGIRVNVMSPGSIDTPMANSAISKTNRGERVKKVPLGRRGEPVEAANLIAFLLLPAASYITAQEVAVSGGLEKTPISDRAWWVNYVAQLEEVKSASKVAVPNVIGDVR